MSRPRSEDKRKAILEAAAKIFAERGIDNAPTSAISKAAGIAEGSLFTYFKTKEELMNELYLEFRREFGEKMAGLPRRASLRKRLRFIWDRFLEMGTQHPERLRVQARLRATGRLFKKNEVPHPAVVEVVNAAREVAGRRALRNLPPDYLVLMMRAHAESTIEYINAHPDRTEQCWEMGFRILWKGLTGK